jgi:hypothetical protein
MSLPPKKKSSRAVRPVPKPLGRRRGPVPVVAPRPAPAGRPEPWHSVSIVSRITTCEAALQCRGKRYLSREAPRLPLNECDRSDACRCVYRHHADRRTGPRRASETGGPPVRSAPGPNLRLKRGRRKLDV